MAILKRTLEMKIRFTKAELDALNKKAKKAQMSREGYCRAVLNGSTVKEAPPADVPALLRAMRQAGYNLDQTLKKFNATSVPDMPQFRKELEEIRTATKLDTLSGFGEYQVVAVFKFDTNHEDFRYNEYTQMNEEQFNEFMSQVHAISLRKPLK